MGTKGCERASVIRRWERRVQTREKHWKTQSSKWVIYTQESINSSVTRVV